MVKGNDIILLRHCLRIVRVDLCKVFNPYIMFYLSYEHQKMAVLNMALRSLNLIIMYDLYISYNFC